MANWRSGWFLDVAPPTLIVVSSGGSPNNLIVAGKYYFEASVNWGDPAIGGTSLSMAFVGIAGSGFLLVNPVNYLVAGSGSPNTANSMFYSGGNHQFGSPNAPAGPSPISAGNVVAVAIDTVAGKMWSRNVTLGGAWIQGDPGAGGLQAGTFSGGGTSPITGGIYALIGVGTQDRFDQTAGDVGRGTINFGATAFAGAVPTGFAAWDVSGASALNPFDAAAGISFSGGNLTYTGSVLIPGGGLRTAFARSNTAVSQ